MKNFFKKYRKTLIWVPIIGAIILLSELISGNFKYFDPVGGNIESWNGKVVIYTYGSCGYCFLQDLHLHFYFILIFNPYF